MIPITEPPSIVKKFTLKFRDCFSKPQYNHFITYLTGLIISNNKTIQGINNSFLDHKDQSCLNNFITDSDWDEQAVNSCRIKLIKEHTKQTQSKDTFLILDDTLSHKTGKKIEQIELVFDHSIKKNVLAHQVVTSLLVSKEKHFPLDFRLYKKHKEGDPSFKTKIQLAIDLIKNADENGIDFSCVLFDSWYLASKVIDVIKKLKKFWISPLKSNRIVLKNNKRIRLKEYISNIPKNSFIKKKIKGKYYYYYAETLKISKLGKIFVIAFHNKEDLSDSVTVLGSNALTWTPDKIIYSFKQRWSIETFYRDSKQNLGFEDYELRKLKGIIRHWYLVFLAYTFLQLSASNKNLTKWVNSNLKTIGDQCRFATNETIKYFILWVIKMYHKTQDEEKVITLVFNPKANFRFSFE